MIHRWYYSEIKEELYKIKEGYITRYFVEEEKYQTYSPIFGSKEKLKPERENDVQNRETIQL